MSEREGAPEMNTYQITYRTPGARLTDTHTIGIKSGSHAGAQIYFHRTFPDWAVVQVKRTA